MCLLCQDIYIHVHPKNTDKKTRIGKKDRNSSHMLYLLYDNIFNSATENDWLHQISFLLSSAYSVNRRQTGITFVVGMVVKHLDLKQ